MRSVALLLAFTASAAAYGVGPAIALDELAQKATVICKATAIADKRASDASLGKVFGYPVHETKLRTISCIKGSAPKTFKFRHYAYDPPPNSGIAYSPLHYELTPGKVYIVFAVRNGGVYRPLFKEHTQKEDQGLFRAGDDKPLKGATVSDAIWAELQRMLASSVADDVAYAIGQLDQMSGGGLDLGLKDFDRQAALADIRKHVQSKNPVIAEAALDVFGGDSPFYVETDAPYWLAGVGKGTIAGLSPRKPLSTVTADFASSELLAVANGSGAAHLRGLAIRALGRTRAITLPAVTTWERSADREVRRAAIIVSAQLSDRSLIAKAVVDADADVRRTGALAVGFTQDPKLLPALGKLLADGDANVRAAAAMAILSFSPDLTESLMKAQLSSDYMPLFVNVLARKDPKPYLVQLANVVEKQLQPAGWWGGRIPAADSWEILFNYVKAQPQAELSRQPLGNVLDSLERMKWFSSSEPRDLYALYVRRGLTARAKRFRDSLKQTASYVEQYLDAADQHPEHFVP